MTTQTGFGLANHSVGFVEYAPPRYEPIREILLRDRALVFAEKGHFGNTSWFALPEMIGATGKNIPQLSRELQDMSVYLFREHPARYALSVAKSWVDFWTVPIIWIHSNVKSETLASVLDAVWWIEHKMLRVSNVLFVALVGLIVPFAGVRRRIGWNLALTIVSTIILASSLVQALADYGASSRYAVTVQPLVLLVLAIVAFNVLQRRRVRDSNGLSATGVRPVTALPGGK
jgi:hypothetical protein